MKVILLIFSAFVLQASLFAQSKQETKVANAVEQLRKAMIDANKPELERLTADQLSYGHSSGAIDDKKLFVEKLITGKSDFVSIDLAEQSISITNKTAIVRHISKAKTNDGGKPGEVSLRILLVFQKQSGSWKLLARQALKA